MIYKREALDVELRLGRWGKKKQLAAIINSGKKFFFENESARKPY